MPPRAGGRVGHGPERGPCEPQAPGAEHANRIALDMIKVQAKGDGQGSEERLSYSLPSRRLKFGQFP